jgi:hypothetical protein
VVHRYTPSAWQTAFSLLTFRLLWEQVGELADRFEAAISSLSLSLRFLGRRR